MRLGAVERGVTLIELSVAIALLALLLGLGFPSLTLWVHNTQVRTTAEALQNGVRLAQAEALRRNRQVVMTFTNDASPTLNPTAVAGGQSWALQTVPSAFINNNVAEFLGSGVLTSQGASVTITGVGGAYAAICFNANGRLIGPTGNAATANCSLATPLTAFSVAWATASNRPMNVTIAVGGQVRICDPNLPALSSTSPGGC